MKYLLQYFFILTIFGLLQTGCDIREATIVYDVDFPRADSDEAQGGNGDDGGSTPGGPRPLILMDQELATLSLKPLPTSMKTTQTMTASP